MAVTVKRDDQSLWEFPECQGYKKGEKTSHFFIVSKAIVTDVKMWAEKIDPLCWHWD